MVILYGIHMKYFEVSDYVGVMYEWYSGIDARYNGNEKDSFSLPSTNVEHGGNSKGSSQSSHESSEVLPEEMLESSSSKPKSKNGSSVVVVGA